MKNIKKIIFFVSLIFCIQNYAFYGFSMPKTSVFDDFLDRVYEWLLIKGFSKIGVNKKQQQMINSLKREQEAAFASFFYTINRINPSELQALLKRRKARHEDFQKQLTIARDDYFHDPRLSKESYLNFKIFCSQLGISPYAIDIRYIDDIPKLHTEANFFGYAIIENNKPIIYLKIGIINEGITLLHEVSHHYFGHLVDNDIMQSISYINLIYDKNDFDRVNSFDYVREHQADLLPRIIANQSYSEAISDYYIGLASFDGYVRGLDALHVKKLIKYRLFTQEEDKTLDNELLYGYRCNETIEKKLYIKDPRTNKTDEIERQISEIERQISERERRVKNCTIGVGICLIGMFICFICNSYGSE